MKKILLLSAIILVTVCATGQEKKSDLMRKCYVESAAARYDLDEAQQKTLSEAYVARKKAANEINKKKKSGEISAEMIQSQKQANYSTFMDVLKALTGKKQRELTAFDSETYKKCAH